MQRRCVIAVAFVEICIAGTVSAGGKGGGMPASGGAASLVQAWAGALQARDEVRLHAMMAPDVGYARLDLVGRTKIHRVSTGAVQPALFLHPAEVHVVKTRPATDGALGVLTQVVEEGAVREWQTWVTLRPGPAGWQVAEITDVAMEGSYPGDPEGCPETSAKRHEVVTLYGPLAGNGGEQTIRVFQTRRDTDAWAFAGGEAKGCTPRPGLALEDLEIVVHESSGRLLGYQHLGRVDRTTGGGGRGIALYTGADGGALVAGGARLYAVPGAPPLLFLARTWLTEKSQQEWQAVHRVDAYRWDGAMLRRLWGFDFGKEGGAIGGSGGRVIWALKSPTPDGTIHADLAATGTSDCQGSVQFTWAGGGFKMRKEGVRGPCLGTWWPGGESGILGQQEVNLDRLARKATKRGEGEE